MNEGQAECGLRPVVIIPTLNEVRHIAAVIAALSEPGSAGCPPRIWILDGLSPDGTADAVRRLGLDHVTVIDNPDRTQAHAMNLAARRARAEGDVDVLIRADAHAHYPAGFVTQVLATMAKTGADSVVVPLRTIGGSRLQDAAAVLFGSFLGTGGSPHRMGTTRGFVEHGHHAAMRLDAYLAAGGYDTDFQANEDAEFDFRLIRGGGCVFLENGAAVDYIPRPSLKGTFRQYFRNGVYRIRRCVKHGEGFSPRATIPALLLPGLVLGTLLGIFLSSVFLIAPAGYVLAVPSVSSHIARKADRPELAGLVAVLAATTHFAFSAGASLEMLRCLLSPARRRNLRDDQGRLIT